MRSREELLLAMGVRVPAWQRQAACRGMGPDAMYPQGRGDAWSTKASLEVCKGCPVAVECRAYALAHRDVWGVWGGTTGRSRKRTLGMYG